MSIPIFRSFSLISLTYCHGKNHTKDRCYKLFGYPSDPNNRGRKKPFTKPGQFDHFQSEIFDNSGNYVVIGNKSGHAMQASSASPSMTSFPNASSSNFTDSSST